MSKQRIVSLQKQVSLARSVLIRIATGHSRNPEHDANEVLDELDRLDPKRPLQYLVGHEHRAKAFR